MPIVRKDKLVSGKNGNLETVKVHNNAGTATVQTTNGVFVVAEGLMAGEREVKKARLASSADAVKDVLLVHAPEVPYDERQYNNEDAFVIEQDQAVRAYRLASGDIITLTQDLFTATPTVGQVLVTKTNGLLGVDATAQTTAKVIFTVIEDSGYELHLTKKAFAVQVTVN